MISKSVNSTVFGWENLQENQIIGKLFNISSLDEDGNLRIPSYTVSDNIVLYSNKIINDLGINTTDVVLYNEPKIVNALNNSSYVMLNNPEGYINIYDNITNTLNVIKADKQNMYASLANEFDKLSDESKGVYQNEYNSLGTESASIKILSSEYQYKVTQFFNKIKAANDAEGKVPEVVSIQPTTERSVS